MSCTDVNDDIFVSLDSRDIEPSDLIELVTNATLRRESPSPKDAYCIQLTPPVSQYHSRPSSPLDDATFSALGDCDSIVTQITLINGEKILVREDVSDYGSTSSPLSVSAAPCSHLRSNSNISTASYGSSEGAAGSRGGEEQLH